MKWIKNHKLISFLLAVILLSLIVLVASVASGGRGNFISNLAGSIYSAIEKPVSGVAGGISDRVSGLFSYRDIQKENDRLKKENENLKQELAAMTLSANELKELKQLSKLLNYSGISGSGDIVSCDVISMDGTKWMNIFTIDCGSESGVKEGNVVICGDGLVGRVHSVGKGWSKVVALIDESSRVTFKVSGNLQLIGVIEGCTDGILSGFMLDDKAKIREGDKLVTSGMGIYPAGIEIGRIVKVRYDSNAQLQRVDVKPSVDFKSLQKVTVIL
ncbi:rod shape-determining protein MreC [Ihubacter sp. rT4E-8]|uniref:rod shape-determining protein MreC n=1 Tax=Ihubacter sp. rT4E-8 TaxID=3242369 RepID=UPI003CF2EB21